jgi:hypothetical protein
MYIANDDQVSLARIRHETLRRWVEELLANERFGAAADNMRDAAARKIQLRARGERHRNSRPVPGFSIRIL